MRMNERGRWLTVALAAGVLVLPVLPSARAVPGAGGRPAFAGAAATSGAIYVPASAHAGGANGADWRTDLQIHNAGTTATTATIALLSRDNANPSPDTRAVAVAAGASVRLPDVLLNTFGFTGAAALRVTSTSSRLAVTSRTYNLVGEGASGLPQGASFGQFVRGVPEESGIAYGEEGRLIQLTQRDASSGLDFRTNVGFVNLGPATIEVRIDLYRADGSYLGTRSGDETRLRAYEFRQITEIMRSWGTIADGYAVARTTTPGGRFLAFATVIDNHLSGDPVFVPAAKLVSAAPSPTPTPTPPPMPTSTPSPTATPTPTSTPSPTATPTPTPSSGWPNLVIYKPPTWPGCVVCNYRNNCCPPSTELLSEYQPTVVMFALANTGTVRLTGTVRFGFSLDGVLKTTASWSNDSGLDPGYYKSLSATWPSSVPLPAGRHTLTVTADPYFDVAESDETDNSCAFTGEWSSVVFLKQGGSGTGGADTGVVAPFIVREEGSPEPIARAVAAPALPATRLATAGETWIPASAHATGVNGTNWRTDLEIHNPGTTAAAYTITLLPRDADNTTAAAQLAFSLDPQKSVRYVDVLDSVFHFTGAAALRIVPTTGTILATSRTYNLVGANSSGLPVGASFGQFVPGLAESEAISSTEEGRLIQLTQRDAGSGADFRTNVGIVNTTGSSVDVRLDFFRSDGTWLGVKQGSETRLPPYGFRQLTEAFNAWGTTADGYVVARPTTSGGRIFAFATVIDNHVTGDPVFIPAERMAASAVPTPTPTPTATPTPTPGPGIVTGPGGSTIALPTGGQTPNAPVTITTGNGSGLANAGETLISTVIAIGVGGEGSTTGAGPFLVNIPVTGSVDPSKLLLKVRTSVGPVYPVAGVYSPASKIFTAELEGLWDGWTMGVVSNPGLEVLAPAEALGGVGPLGWVTPDDWKTCAWRIIDDRPKPAASLTFPGEIAKALGKACDHLRSAQFRSPKLWMNSTESPKARTAHVVAGTGPNDPGTSFGYSGREEDAAFSLAGLTDAQMQDLGQLYFNWDDWASVIQPQGWSYENVTIHELFHAVQKGYDFRQTWVKTQNFTFNPAMGLKEGTATLVGQMFQSNLNGLYGGDVTVRSLEPPEKLSQTVLYECCIDAYARQDFFAYVAKRWNGGSLLDLRWLFQHLSDQTDGQFGKMMVEYSTLYRRAMDFHYQNSLSLTLPELYKEFALDRAYRHNAPALLRAVDGSLPKNSLDPSLFKAVGAWDPAQAAPLVLKDLWPLTTEAVRVPVSAADRTAKKVTMPIAVTGATFGKQGVRIFVFPEKGGVLEAGAEMEVTDVSKPVDVTVGADTTTLTVLVLNGSIENVIATVTFGGLGFSRLSLGSSTYTFLCTSGICALTCGMNDGDPVWSWPLTWTGNTFVSPTPLARVSGELSADRKVLLSFKFEDAGFGGPFVTYMHWVNLPLDTARSTSGRLVFAVAGEAAASHIAVAKTRVCSPDSYSGIDYGKPVLLEVFLDP